MTINFHAKHCMNLEVDSVVIHNLYISCKVLCLAIGSLGTRILGGKKAMIAYIHYV